MEIFNKILKKFGDSKATAASFWRALRTEYWDGHLNEFFFVNHGPRKLDHETLMAVVDEAWIDNAPVGQFFARSAVRLHFNEVVGKYVAEYFRLTGQLPVGNHHVSLRSAGMVYFRKFQLDSPRSTLGSSSTARSSAS